jgi:hypothetical protein
MPKRQQRKKQLRPRKRQRRTGGGNRLPQIDATPINRLTARYGGNITLAASESVVTINAQEFMFAPGAIALTSSTYACIAQGVRIKSVEVWCTPVINGSSGAAISTVSVGVSWYSSVANASGRVQTDTSLSYASPAHVHAIPERGSLCSFWFNQVGNAPMFDIVCNSTVAGNVTVFLAIDVIFEWVASNQSYAVLSKSTGSTLTAGSMVYPPLDGPGGAFSRMGLPAIS